MDTKSSERRKYLRVESKIGLRVINEADMLDRPVLTNLSPIGLRYNSSNIIKNGESVDMTLFLPQAKNPVHVRGRVVWRKKMGPAKEDAYDIGCEFMSIEEDNKNTFLKFFCDLIYAKSISVKEEG